MGQNIADMIDGLDLFRDFAYRELEVVAGYLAYQEVPRGDTIFREGDPGSNMLILLEGKMGIYKGGESGQYLLSYEGRGRMVGDMALLDRELRSASCVAESDCQLLSLGGDALDRMALEAPAVAYHFMHNLARLLSKRLRRTSGILAEHLLN
ncbi:cyclic nucleotide-binding domain-containing protein [Dechloromonas sp. ZY10]|uniref:Crp/Fnr family transcriptional regulator n=1 Tax=Dechloromonas aquae TaxID=2664436 RepID=UPI00352752CC